MRNPHFGSIVDVGYDYTTALKAKSDLIPLTNIHSAPIKNRLRDFVKI
jgi:hypothetical protein